MAELRKKLDAGEINYMGEICQTRFTSSSDRHKDILDNWSSSYGGSSGDALRFKNHLSSLKHATDSGSSSGYIFASIPNGSGVTAVLVHFTELQNKKRTYSEMTISMAFTSDSAKSLVRDHPVELAVLVLSGKTENLTINFW